jgi:hypothetical protein
MLNICTLIIRAAYGAGLAFGLAEGVKCFRHAFAAEDVSVNQGIPVRFYTPKPLRGVSVDPLNVTLGFLLLRCHKCSEVAFLFFCIGR